MKNIICRICNRSFQQPQQLTHHLSSTHKINCDEYIKYNILDFIVFGWKQCIECNTPFKGDSSKCGKCYSKTHNRQENQYLICHLCGFPFHSKVLSQHLKRNHNVIFREYIKENLTDFERFNWSKCSICGNITKKQGNKHLPTCSPKCLSEYRKTLTGKNAPRFGAVLSDKTKEKISAGNIGKDGLRGDLNPSCRREVRNKISKTRIDRGVAKGRNNPMYGKTHTPEAIQKIFAHRKMNKLEALVAEQLDKSGIAYYFQYFINSEGVCKSYDFKIKNKPLIIEVDGDFWHGNPSKGNHYEKVDAVRKNDQFKDELAQKMGFRVIRMWESDIKKDPSIVLKHIV